MTLLELRISKIESLIKEHIQTYIDNFNNENPDTPLLEDFNEEFLYVWEPLRNLPPRGVVYYLGPQIVNPKTDSEGETGVALNHRILFAAVLRENGKKDSLQRSHRYLDMLMRLFNDKILIEVKDATLTDVDILPFEIPTSGVQAFGPGLLIDTLIPY